MVSQDKVKWRIVGSYLLRPPFGYRQPFIKRTHAPQTFVQAAKPKSRLDPALRAQLPPQLIEMLSSPQFIEACMQSFDAVDKDKSGE